VAAAKEERRKKAQQLERYEAARQEKEAAKSPKQQSEFLTRLITRVVSNLLVTVNDIHIRYEDTASDPQVRRGPSHAGADVRGRLTATKEEAAVALGRRQHPQALGVTLASLTVNATDAKWHETFLEEVGKEIYKVRHGERQRLSPRPAPDPSREPARALGSVVGRASSCASTRSASTGTPRPSCCSASRRPRLPTSSARRSARVRTRR